jgi:protein-S-isoprenylcysteine O-methyltransferase Ste14
MGETVDNANVVILPPVLWAIVFAAGLAADWLYPLHFVPPAIPPIWTGSVPFAIGLALGIWAIITIRQAATPVEPTRATTAIVSGGPYGFTRNPIYLGMLLGQAGLSIGFDTLWGLVGLLPFYLVLRHGVIAREEAYLQRKFGAAYLGYKSCVRRWM